MNNTQNNIFSLKLSIYTDIRHGMLTQARKNIPSSSSEWFKFLRTLHLDSDITIVINEQAHTGNAQIIKQTKNKRMILPNNDGMVTNLNDTALLIYTADCLPIMFYEPIQHVIGIAHAGWKGIIKNIVPHTLQLMNKKLKADPKNIIAYIGPSLCPKHFEVHKDVANQFAIKFTDTKIVTNLEIKDTQGEKFSIDLWRAVTVQLLDFGILEKNIENSRICTCEYNNLFSSERFEKNQRDGSNWSYIVMHRM